MHLIRFEYRKLWNRIACFAIIAFCLYSIIHSVVYLKLQWRTLDGNGEIVDGLAAYRTLMANSEDIAGTVDDAYLHWLVEEYNSSFDKQYLQEHRGFLGTGGMTKFQFPNYFINYAYYGPYMSNGNDKINLDYDFLESADSFYRKFKAAQKEELMYTMNLWPGIASNAEMREAFIDRKIESQQMPFEVSYHAGINNFRQYLLMQYPYFLIVIAVILSCVYSKDSMSGITELTLTSLHGRGRDMKARWIAGNLFALSVYAIFIGTLTIVHASIAGFGGWNGSMQTAWFHSLHNFSIGQAVLIIVGCGALGTLAIANLAMMISMLVKKNKLSAIISAASVLFMEFASNRLPAYAMAGQLKKLLPSQFVTDTLVEDYVFIGAHGYPYFALVMLISAVYILLLAALTIKGKKKYCIR